MKKSFLAIIFAIIWLLIIYTITASPSATGTSTLDFIQSRLGINGVAADVVNFIIRKLAHVIVFGSLAVIL